MNKKETAMIVLVLQSAYPMAYKNIDNANLISLWQEMFADEDGGLVAAATRSFIASDISGFPPTVGQIKEMIYKLIEPRQITAQEAWDKLTPYFRRNLTQSEYEKIPFEIRSMVPLQSLRRWANMDSHELHTVVSSNFMKSYGIRIKEVREMAKIPSEIREFIGNTGVKVKMLELDDELDE